VQFENHSAAIGRFLADLPTGTLRGAVRAYQMFLAPVLPRTCRFHPSCSAYALEALSTHGTIGGLWLAARRLLRCHPWGGGGFDPVPAPRTRG
jgi:putative membrane protein insertion efficiency factor